MKKKIFSVIVALIGIVIAGLGSRKLYLEKKGGDF